MTSFLRSLLYGLLAGVFLALVRAPAGLDWTQIPGVEGSTAALFRAAGLIAVAIFLGTDRPAFRGSSWPLGLLLGLVLGFSAAGIGLAPPLDLPSPLAGRTGFGLLLLLALPLFRWLAGEGAAPTGELDPRPTAPRERFALAVVGAGLALGLENLASNLRVFGGGLALDDTIFGTAFLLSVFVGALAFGALVARPGLARFGLSLGSTLAAAAAAIGLQTLRALDQDGLWIRLHRFGLDPSRIGSPGADLLLGTTVLIVPGFLLGAGIVAAANPTKLRSLLLGGAVGLLLRGPALALLAPESYDAEGASSLLQRIAMLATAIAALGTIAALMRSGMKGSVVGSLLALAAPAALGFLPAGSYLLSPWYGAPLDPIRVVPTASGIVSLVGLPSGATVVTVDGRRVTPTPDEEEFDDHLFLTAWALLPADLRKDEGPRVLFVGVMTARRADLIRRLTKRKVDRTVPWFEAQDEIDALLLSPEARSASRAIAPAEARRRLKDSRYDLVLVAPVRGPIQSTQAADRIRWAISEAPVLEPLTLPAGTLGVAWQSGESTLSSRRLRGPLLLAADHLTRLFVGVVRGLDEENSAPPRGEEPPLLFAGSKGAARTGTVSLMKTIPWFRAFAPVARLADRIARATEEARPDSRAAHVARGLAIHFEAQEPSSPFDSAEVNVEIEEDALREWTAGLRSDPGMDPLDRSIWVDVAHVLTAQRSPDLVLAFVEPVADAYAPWAALDAAAGRAHRELLEPELALERFESALATAPGNVQLALDAAEVARELGRSERALEICRRALGQQPGHPELLRAFAISLFATGAPEAEAMLRELLRRDPDDEEVQGLLSPGPAPDAGTDTGPPMESEPGTNTGSE